MDPNPPYSQLWNSKHAADVRVIRDQNRERAAEAERERLEKLRGAEQAVDKHFEASLNPQRLAQHKQRTGGNWSVPVPMPTYPSSSRIVEDPASRIRTDPYFPPHNAVLHPHARLPDARIPIKPDPVLQAQPPFNIIMGYPGFYPNLTVGMMQPEPVAMAPITEKHSIDVKNSVIVKNDTKKQREAHHPSPSLLEGAQNKHVYPSPVYSHVPPPKAKVSTPAPRHIYGKPTSKPSLSTSPFQQLPPHLPPPVANKLPPPPPAHSGGTANIYQSGADQMQPLDLGICLVKSDSPKRKLELSEDENSPAKKSCPEPELTTGTAMVPEQVVTVPTVLEQQTVSAPVQLTMSIPEKAAVVAPTPLPITNPSPSNSALLVTSSTTPPLQTSITPPLTTSSSTPPPTNANTSGAPKHKKKWLQQYHGVDSSTPPPATPTPPPLTASPSPPVSVSFNGHDKSSSSDSESSKPSTPSKVKRKKEKKKKGKEKKKTSGAESDKEIEPKSEGGKKANGGSCPNKSSDGAASKRSSSSNSPRPKEEVGLTEKKARQDDEDFSIESTFKKPPLSQLKKTGESFLQDGACFEVAPKLGKCRECRWTPNQRSRNNSNIFCRFYAFRRLKFLKGSQLAIAGFSDPHKDASPEDVKLWLPNPNNPPKDIDPDLSKFILSQVADQFFDLLRQEEEAKEINMAEDEFVAWKRVVQGVREMCDVCETTLFNFHWTCAKCGFVVCIDCYRDRKEGYNKVWGEGGRDRDDASWLLCNNKQAHEQDQLMLTQIIAADSLLTLGLSLDRYSKTNNIPISSVSSIKDENDLKDGDDKKSSSLTLLADLALEKQQNKETVSASSTVPTSNTSGENAAASNPNSNNVTSSASETKPGGFSTLRKLLVRNEKNSNTTTDSNENKNCVNKTDSNESSKSQEGGATTPVKEENTEQEMVLKHFQRRSKRIVWPTQKFNSVIMTNFRSKQQFPDVPHSWLCDGKLLRLTDPTNKGNLPIFQDYWRRGLPILVSGVGEQLDKELWHPSSFAADFGELRIDLINCITGNILPNQSIRKFWDGFEYVGKRLKDETGNAILLKLKDWPPGDDFAELLPTRFSDLMKVLPLGDYTQRSGRLNLAARLPESFVKPDLGPKMYIAYGNSQFPSKATTNLHLDVSDAVNLMVYVGIPKDGDHDEYQRDALRAIDDGGCDMLTKRRVRVTGELPGALWHIFKPCDADKIRDCLNKVAIEKGTRLERNHDPIHDQSWYLDQELRDRLYREYKVRPYTIVQCLGDAVFIPAGAPHQVRNLHSCIKVAEDFVSPENVFNCFHLTQEFRELSDTHSNHEDKLQIKNIIYHAVKDALSVLEAHNKVESEPVS